MAENEDVRVEVVKPFKVIALICALVGITLIVISLVTTNWLEAEGFQQGLWENCHSGTCSPVTDKLWILVCAVLCIVAVLLTAVGAVLTFISLFLVKRAHSNSRRAIFCAASVIMFFAFASLLATVIVYPVMFIQEIDKYRSDFNITQWFFSWSYGVAWGAAIFVFGSAILLALERETATVMYREKSARK